MSCACAVQCSCALAGCVAQANAINGALGVWPYRLFLSVRKWTGAEPGRGTQVVERKELGTNGKSGGACVAPADVQFSTGTKRGPEGTTATDTVTVSMLDGRYTEEELAPMRAAGAGEEVFYEIVEAKAAELDTAPVVRCTLVGRPVRENAGLNWTMRLRIQERSNSFGGARATEGGVPS